MYACVLLVCIYVTLTLFELPRGFLDTTEPSSATPMGGKIVLDIGQTKSVHIMICVGIGQWFAREPFYSQIFNL